MTLAVNPHAALSPALVSFPFLIMKNQDAEKEAAVKLLFFYYYLQRSSGRSLPMRTL